MNNIRKNHVSAGIYYHETNKTTKYQKQSFTSSFIGGGSNSHIKPSSKPQGGGGGGSVPPTPPITPEYRTTSGNPYCVGYDKYIDIYSQISYDSGSTWETTATTPTLVEKNSKDCGYIPPIEPQYRTISGETYCSGETGYDKYVDVYSQVSYDSGGTWETTATTPTLIEKDSEDCGYVPPIEPQYRWIDDGYMCNNFDKYKKEKKQVSYDSGITWEDVIPTETRMGELIEHNSEDCGYYPLNYLSFKALEDGTFGFSGSTTSNIISYSLDNGATWTVLSTYERTPLINAYDEIYWKGELIPNGGIGRFSSSGRFKASGNIMSLLYGDEFDGKTSLSEKELAFYNLFSGCTGLTSAETMELPATTLSEWCYNGMFYGCSSLTTAPQLPAMTLARGCYEYMFCECTSLTTPPELPATIMENDCYNSMFHSCTSLTASPQLHSTTLADSCYYNMFQHCHSLTVAPELPATTLAYNCYAMMFWGCSGLTAAPELPATTIAKGCYYYMFYGCSSLTTAPSVLPATTLAQNCYYSMFAHCYSLTTAPELPATMLVSGCYNIMFHMCTSLNYIKCLATNISASDCTKDWVYNVAANGTFVKAANMTSWRRGTSGIPFNWTIQNAI